ncbi:flagellar hook-associated protein FlgK [Rhodoplanes sp. TEM]|uniref:Flagellar hook-associated protein 1 n=1 Tax=Rhodoplanes tepidamans TaxID=200616 RepID=A0ABT5JAR8_RHOTP|nr:MULTISPECIES: flagellar hook-associated protein FlgK [Rhodoplanes]MDC7786778.1 flagellar hook-associated protein FlgK [Rhodoplanes tepidamans]MDC7987456.1 flagellar hook-associated protein FlgK [Rhodoplanes sp. TEM]MDQ0356333.1 flagellar hook-associated protein 1 FlgK [Rhodoplanes tepidamans]
MSLAVARNIALSSLMTAQTRISVTSTNIANADTDGYTRKSAAQSTMVTAGVGTGVEVTGISSTVSKMLISSLVDSETRLGAATTMEEYTSLLQQVYGATSSDSDSTSGTSIANGIADLASALTELTDTPESETLQAQVIDTLDSLAAQFRTASGSIQNLRSNADEEIDNAVDEINQSMSDIDSLNERIVAASASGADISDLVDQRNTALQTLGGLMNVTWFTNSNNEVHVYTTGGKVLVDSTVHELSYASASTVTSDTVYSETPPSGFSGIVVDGVDITSHVTSGEVGALIDLRDEILPDAQTDLDMLASTLADALNQVHNQGAALPAPASLTGTTVVAGTDSLGATGTVRFAVVDQDGALVSYEDIDLSTLSTVDDLVSAIDSVDGLSATLDSAGRLVVTSDDTSYGVAINEMDSAVGTDEQGLSDWFGLNDLVDGDSASNFVVRSDILANTSLLAISQLDDSATLTTGETVLASGSATIADGLLDLFESNHSFDAAGNLGNAKTSFATYAAEVVGAAATQYSSASSELSTADALQSSVTDAIASKSGVNLDEETNLLSELQTQYEAAAQVMSIVNELFSTLLDMVSSA